jgi:sugar lactone lactonase YvrE
VGKGQNLLYVSDPKAGDVYMIAVPSGRLVGKLTGFSSPNGDCVDQHENVFVDDSGEGQVRAYAHGAESAFRVLNDASWYPNTCSVDPTTGNLAVCNIRTTQAEGSIAVYLNAKGAAHYYRYSGADNFWYCTYDSDGNLFADAMSHGGGSGSNIFLELPKGHGKLRPLFLRPAITNDASSPLFWDGKYLAIASTSSGAIYRYKISGNTGSRVAVVRLDDTSEVLGPFWITSRGNAQTLYAPIAEDTIERIGVYSYPAGGKRLQDIYDAPLPFAAAVSMPK